ncbi:MAG: hypothetical protein FWC17_00665 [Treponema sp.]|nr:hypothetical protein [Treponema sp.]
MLRSKLVVLFILFVLVFGAGNAFAQINMSYGVGGAFTSAFGGGYEATFPGLGSEKVEFPQTTFGLAAFFDFTYIEASVSLMFGALYTDYTSNVPAFPSYKEDYEIQSMNLSAVLKYPISLFNIISIFPAAGVEYQMVTSMKKGNTSFSDAGDLNSLWFKFGAGLDFNIIPSMFIRGAFYYGIRMPNKFENDLKLLADIAALFSNGSSSENFAHGIKAMLALGIRL